MSNELLTDEVRAALTAGHLAHLVTLSPEGHPHVTVVWVGLEDDEIVAAHLGAYQKVQNIRRDPRVCLSMETGGASAGGLNHYLVINGRARVTEGGAPELLQRLAHVVHRPRRRVSPNGESTTRFHHPDHPGAGLGGGSVDRAFMKAVRAGRGWHAPVGGPVAHRRPPG